VEVRHHRSPEQLKQIEDLARAAIGADAARGDLITVQNLPFQQVTAEAPAPVPLLKRVRNEARDWSQAIRYAAIGLLLLAIYATVLRPIKRQVIDSFKNARLNLAEGKGNKTAAMEGAVASALPEAAESKQLGTLKKQLVDKVKSEPGPSTRLVQTWIQEGSDN
jgi:flagellar M-ring protein FliF